MSNDKKNFILQNNCLDGSEFVSSVNYSTTTQHLISKLRINNLKLPYNLHGNYLLRLTNIRENLMQHTWKKTGTMNWQYKKLTA